MKKGTKSEEIFFLGGGDFFNNNDTRDWILADLYKIIYIQYIQLVKNYVRFDPLLTTVSLPLKEWTDHNLIWNESDYGGVADLRIHPKYLWTPDILMYNRYMIRLQTYWSWFHEAIEMCLYKNSWYFNKTIFHVWIKEVFL